VQLAVARVADGDRALDSAAGPDPAETAGTRSLDLAGRNFKRLGIFQALTYDAINSYINCFRTSFSRVDFGANRVSKKDIGLRDNG
jgi:hypothetical protein